jgi:hypothetical protein
MDSRTREPTSEELLALDIDIRMHAVVTEALVEVDLDHRAAGLMRLAYGAGYCDALRESVRGQLCLDHGYPVPSRPGLV